MLGYGRSHALMKITSAIHAELAVRSTGALQREKRREYWREASRDIVQACRRAPQDGESALMCARIIEQANLSGIRQDDDAFLVSLYERAIFCRPTIRQVTSEAAFALARFYLRSLTLAPEESETLRNQSLTMLCRLLELQPQGSRRIFAVLSSLVEDPDELLKLVPNNYDARSTMMEYLEDRRQYALASHLGELMQQQLPKAGRLDTEGESLQRQAYLYRHQMMQMELLGQARERQALWEKTMDIARKRNLSPEWSEDVTKDNDALIRFRSAARIARRIFPLNEENMLHEAQLHDFLAHPQDVISALLPLTYQLDHPVDEEILRQARQLLADAATQAGVEG